MTSSLTHDSTYFVGEKWRRGSPTTHTNKSAETVVVERDALVEVRMRFVWENPHSYSLEIGTIFKAFFKSTKFSGNIFWFKLSGNQLFLDNCDFAKITAKIYRTRERMFSSQVVRELPDYCSTHPKSFIKKEEAISWHQTHHLQRHSCWKNTFLFFPTISIGTARNKGTAGK
jgi:hypothetical protein